MTEDGWTRLQTFSSALTLREAVSDFLPTPVKSPTNELMDGLSSHSTVLPHPHGRGQSFTPQEWSDSLLNYYMKD